MGALTTSGQEEPRISQQAPEISAQPALYPPEPLALQLTGKHLLPTPLYKSLHFDVLQCASPCDRRGFAPLFCPCTVQTVSECAEDGNKFTEESE